jgi:uncharacterized protein (TIGR02145 family)
MITAPLAGNRNTDGSFNNLSSNANLWSSSESSTSAWKRNLNSGNATVNRNTNDKGNGFSVRCLENWFKGIGIAPAMHNNVFVLRGLEHV